MVDDEESVRRALARLLRSAGLDVLTFESALDFLEHPPEDRAACLVLDVRLSGMSGPGLQSALSAADRPVPIIFITGHGDVRTSVRAMKGGAVDFLQKPFNDAELLDCVQRALALGAQIRTARAEQAELRSRHATLTPRERQVISQVVTGRLNKQIASELGIAEKTIKVHRGRVMEKMRADSVAALVRMAEKLDVHAVSRTDPL